jgi:hypothetical protein
LEGEDSDEDEASAER